MQACLLAFLFATTVCASINEVGEKRQFEDVGVSHPFSSSQSPVSWIWVGGVTDRSAEFRVRTKAGTEVILFVSDESSPAELTFQPAVGDPSANAYTFRFARLG